MISCTKCKEEAVENWANGNKFYYCKGCKIEVVGATYVTPPHVTEAMELLGELSEEERAEAEEWFKSISGDDFDGGDYDDDLFTYYRTNLMDPELDEVDV